MTPEQIKEVLGEGIDMKCYTFVVNVLSNLCNDERDLVSIDISNFNQVVRESPPAALSLLRSF